MDEKDFHVAAAPDRHSRFALCNDDCNPALDSASLRTCNGVGWWRCFGAWPRCGGRFFSDRHLAFWVVAVPVRDQGKGNSCSMGSAEASRGHRSLPLREKSNDQRGPHDHWRRGAVCWIGISWFLAAGFFS